MEILLKFSSKIKATKEENGLLSCQYLNMIPIRRLLLSLEKNERVLTAAVDDFCISSSVNSLTRQLQEAINILDIPIDTEIDSSMQQNETGENRILFSTLISMY